MRTLITFVTGQSVLIKEVQGKYFMSTDMYNRQDSYLPIREKIYKEFFNSILVEKIHTIHD
jgi:hypothetical protein